ncbi:MAG: hypothetical protein ACYC9R_02985 [Nitrosotalea sp.]
MASDMALVFESQITQVEPHSNSSYYLEKIIELPSSLIPKFDLKMLRSDLKYFLQNKNSMLQDPKRKGKKYVAIHNEKVLGYGDDEVEFTKQMYQEHGYIPILIRQLDASISYRIYSPHLK